MAGTLQPSQLTPGVTDGRGPWRAALLETPNCNCGVVWANRVGHSSKTPSYYRQQNADPVPDGFAHTNPLELHLLITKPHTEAALSNGYTARSLLRRV